MLFGERLRQLRKGKYTQEELAELMNVNNNTISLWENGTQEPRAKMVAELARILGTTSAYLMGETETPEREESLKPEAVSEMPERIRISSDSLVYERNGERLELPPTDGGYAIMREIGRIIAGRGTVNTNRYKLMEKTYKRRFCAWPVPKTPEEESALQALKLEDKYILWTENYNSGNCTIVATYYFYADDRRKEYLICEVIVTTEGEPLLSRQKMLQVAQGIYESGMDADKQYLILPEHIRADKNEEYCLRQLSKSVADWLKTIMENAA